MTPFSLRSLFAVTALLLAAHASAADFEVTQRDKKFSQSKLAVKVADVVSYVRSLHQQDPAVSK